ncbi:MAG: hypothetical protein H0V34_09505 [Gammaproteobacteria bacterium]|nr:hypothetical protein [Gammaproteobacteria bacterium]
MRIALQNTLALLALYLVLVICLIVVLRAELGAALFDRIYASVLLAALSGLGSIILIGALLQVQLKRMSAGLAALMEAVANGDTEALRQRDDEFSAVRDAANRLGNEITAARDKLDAVANVFDVGVILISPDGSPDYINQTARQILICNRVQDFAARFTEMYVKLKEAIDKVCQGSGGGRD